MFKVVAEPRPDLPLVPMGDMNVGDIGEYGNEIVIRFGIVRRHVVSLTNPEVSWSDLEPGTGCKVRLLPPGTVLRLVVEGGAVCSQ